MISPPFPHHTVALLRPVGMMSLTPLLKKKSKVVLLLRKSTPPCPWHPSGVVVNPPTKHERNLEVNNGDNHVTPEDPKGSLYRVTALSSSWPQSQGFPETSPLPGKLFQEGGQAQGGTGSNKEKERRWLNVNVVYRHPIDHGLSMFHTVLLYSCSFCQGFKHQLIWHQNDIYSLRSLTPFSKWIFVWGRHKPGKGCSDCQTSLINHQV